MKCPNCNKENRDIAIYCKWCGHSLITKEDNPLSSLVGMTKVKEQLLELVSTCEKIALRTKKTGVKVRLGMDMVISGNTGTGKTELIEAIQKLLFSKGIIKSPTAMIVDAVDYDDFSRKAEKRDNLEENLKKAKGGLLVIENAQKLIPETSSKDINKLDRLFKYMNGEIHDDPIIILSGLSGLRTFMLANPDIACRFEYHFDMFDFTIDELAEICKNKLKEDQLTLTAEAEQKLLNILTYEYRNKKSDFSNGHFACAKANDIFSNAIRRDSSCECALPEDITGKEFKQKSYEEIMAELDCFVGIDEIKNTIKKIINNIDIQSQRDGNNYKREIKDHFLFLGNPGTGKTTIARIFADILNSINVLPVGQLIEVSRKDLVASYVGQTAIAVEKAVQRAMGGVLFIDEAYSLIKDENDSFGKEAIDTLLKLVEDYRGKFVVIAAGYTKEMSDFLNANSGMASRFNETVNFRDYNAEELTEIFRRLLKKGNYVLDEDAAKNIEPFFKNMYLSRNKSTFGNAREVRNIYDKAIKNQAVRLQELKNSSTDISEQINVLTREDIEGKENTKEKDIDTILSELDEFIGMRSVKSEIRKLANKLMVDKKMMELGFGDPELTNIHIILTGNPGTGKTTVANKLGEIFKAIGLLPSAKVVSKEPKDILSSVMNQTAVNMDKACDEAMGATLLIDEAYNLAKVDSTGNVDPVGSQAVDALMTRMSKDAGKFVVIIAGYKDRIEQFIRKANPGLERRFTCNMNIEDYNAKELADIFILNAKKNKQIVTQEAQSQLLKLTNQMVETKKENFGNAGEIIKVLTQAKTNKANRLSEILSQGNEITKDMYLTIEKEDIPFKEVQGVDKDECMKELKELIGLDSVKKNVSEIANWINIEKAKAKAFGKKFNGVADHYLFLGNPGTGKTTVARIMANVFYSLGVLPTNKLIETSRDGLIGQYQGQTVAKTKEVFQSAMGGLLFIDEAYALKQSEGDMYGQEAIDTLLKLMEDNRGRMICIAAGYPKEMKKWLDSNSGLTSRFNKVINFDDYNGEQLSKIFIKKITKDQLSLSPEADIIMHHHFDDIYNHRGPNFGNARLVNSYFTEVKSKQSSRMINRINKPDFDVNEFKVLTAEDME